jgi:hypothetical protein
MMVSCDCGNEHSGFVKDGVFLGKLSILLASYEQLCSVVLVIHVPVNFIVVTHCPYLSKFIHFLKRKPLLLYFKHFSNILISDFV